MASQVQICNLALSHLGQSGIQSLGEASAAAEHCSLAWGPALEAALRDHNWNFATRYQALASLGGPPPHWRWRYAAPADLVRARFLLPVRKGDPTPAFEIALADDGATRIVLTDAAQAWLCYTGLIANTSLYDALFVDALAWRLAADLAAPLTQSDRRHQVCLNRYQGALAGAKGADAAEGGIPHDALPGWIAARGIAPAGPG